MITHTYRLLASRFATWPWIAALAAYMAGFRINTDAFWMARAGAEALSLGRIIGPDRWSWDPVPGNFVPVSPGWELLLGVAFRSGGVRTVQVVVGIATAFAIAGFVWVSRSIGATSGAALVALGLTEIVANTLQARASFIALSWFLVSLAVLQALCNEGRRRPVLKTFGIALMVTSIGVWLHASWCAFAMVLPLATAVFSHQQQLSKRVRLVASVTTGSLIGVASSPVGFGIWEVSARLGEACQGLVSEWARFDQFGLRPQAAAAVVIAVVVGVSLQYRDSVRGTGQRRRLEALLLTGALLSAALGWFAYRFFWQAALLAMPSLALAITTCQPSLLQRLSTFVPHTLRGSRQPRSFHHQLAGALILVILIALAADRPLYKAPTLIQKLPAGCNLHAASLDVDNVALALRPDVHTWIDGRLQYWGRDRMLRYVEYHSGQSPSGLVPGGTTCVITESSTQQRLRTALARSGQWSVAASENGAELWLLRRS